MHVVLVNVDNVLTLDWSPAPSSYSDLGTLPWSTMEWETELYPSWCAALQDKVDILTSGGGPDVVYISTDDSNSWMHLLVESLREPQDFSGKLHYLQYLIYRHWR